MKNRQRPPHCGGQFNTLAQNGTGYFDKPAILVKGNGSELGNNTAMKGRAKRKLITQTMMLNLVTIAEMQGSAERKKAYWNTYHCQNKVYTVNGRLYGKYCKNRFCTLCCCIRKAEIINKYQPVIKTWDKPYFVTLTVKSQPLKNLNKFMKAMIRAFKKYIPTLKSEINGAKESGLWVSNPWNVISTP